MRGFGRGKKEAGGGGGGGGLCVYRREHGGGKSSLTFTSASLFPALCITPHTGRCLLDTHTCCLCARHALETHIEY